MTATYSHPPHPSTSKLGVQSAAPEPTNSDSSVATDRDPHALPSFELNEHKTPVLYLPPLLSSLPARLPAVTLPEEHPPLVTETRLPDIDPASLSLHKALHHFKPLTPDYAEIPYGEAFNWDNLRLPEDEEREWYCVVFRSQRKAGSNGDGVSSVTSCQRLQRPS